MKNRRKSRELALQVLYAREIGGHGEVDAIGHLVEELGAESGCDAQTAAYAEELVRKTAAAGGEIDAAIQEHCANWDLKRMAAVDRNVLRLAVAEMKFCADVPYKVVIDEAIELAKLYGTDDSGKFVNGVIDSIRKALFSDDASS